MAPLGLHGKRRGSLVSRHLLAATTLVVAAALALGTARISEAATTATATTSYKVTATLNTKQEVPVPKDAIHASGLFTGKLTLAGKKSSFTWLLKLSHLSGHASEADLAMGPRGKKGVTILPLCKKCMARAHGAYVGGYVSNKTFISALRHGQLYVTVTTKLNPRGEIRGQIKATAA